VLKRLLRIDLPDKQSAFLWGPRKTGKTSFLRATFPDSLTFDMRQTDVYLELIKTPSLFREQVLAAPATVLRKPIIVDEVQKVPALLDEIHWLIENRGLRFILSGSSARKVRRGKANLLGGRAWRFEMHPLVFPEVPDFELLRALNRGLLAAHYLQNGYRKSLQAYGQDYLKEEVFGEGLTRNIAAFSRFVDAVAYSHGELTNYANIARDCGVDAKTVKEYYQILVDTLLGVMVEPYARRKGREVISKAGKFYLFDVGVAGSLIKRHLTAARGEQFGRAFGHFVLMQLLAHRSYTELGYDIHFWRTKSGLEVDFVLGLGEVAVEVKGSDRVGPGMFQALRAFIEEHRPGKALLVCNEPRARLHAGVLVLPWRDFLEGLWGGQIIS